jgi:hypothetical protein
MLKLSHCIRCTNKEGSRVLIVVVIIRWSSVKIYVAAEEGGAQGKRKEGMKLSVLPTTKIGGKTSLGPNHFAFCKIFIPSYAFDALLLFQNWPFSPP